MSVAVTKKSLLSIRRDKQIASGTVPGAVSIGAGGGSGGLYYLQTALDAGQLDNRYYTETELNAGQLNNLYYTETELNAGQLNNLYYTETELNNGQLNNLYYTETEVNTWRNSVTQTEMGYLDGVSSDIQTQITARAIIGTNPADNRVCTWTNATTIQGESNLVFDGTNLVNKGNTYKQYSTEATKTDWRLTLNTADADLTRIYNYDEGETAYRDMVLGNSTNFLYLDLANTRVGIGTNSPALALDVDNATSARFGYNASANAYIEIRTGTIDSSIEFIDNTDVGRWEIRDDAGVLDFNVGTGGTGVMHLRSTGRVGINDSSPDYTLDVNGTGRFTGNLYGDAAVQNLSFASGFQGDKWQITEDGDAEFENMFIRGGLTVWELIINRLRYQLGGMIIGPGGGKVSEVVDATVNAEQLFFEDPEGNNIIPFTVGAIVMVQDVDLDRTTVVKRYARQVSALTDVGGKWRIDLTTTANAPANVGTFAKGDEVVAIGHVSDTNLDSFLYMSAVDSNNPFFRIMDGVDDYAKFSLGANTGLRLQMGNLNGTYGYASEIYGFAAGDPNNEYMTVDPTNGIRFFNDAGTKVAELAGSSFLVGSSGSNRIQFDGTTFTIVATTYDLSASNLSITSATGIEIGSDFWKNDKTFQFGGGILNGTDSTVNIAGWTAKATSLYTGTEHLGDDWNAAMDGITLVNDGSIHAPNIYVNTGGEIGLRQVENVLFKQDITFGYGIKISGYEIWENEVDTDDGTIYINVHGYDGGSTRFRHTVIGDGKGATAIDIDPSDNKIDFLYPVNIYNPLLVNMNTASDVVATFFNDGDNGNRYGIKIRCGEDVLDADNNYPIRFHNGADGYEATLYYDNAAIGFLGISDIRLKENIKDCNIDGLDIINQMQYRSFNWKKDKKKNEIHGWVADEIEYIFPEMVKVDKETGLKMMDKSRLIPVMMSAIKELSAKVKILESK